MDGASELSKTRAKTLIDYLISRRKQGLATMKQVSWLINQGVDPQEARNMKFKEASERGRYRHTFFKEKKRKIRRDNLGVAMVPRGQKFQPYKRLSRLSVSYIGKPPGLKPPRVS